MDPDPGSVDTTRRWEVPLFGLFGAPPPIEIGQILLRFWRQVVRFDGTGQVNGHPDLVQVGGTVGARPEMGLESASVPPGESPFEIVGDEFDRMLAHDVFPSQR